MVTLELAKRQTEACAKYEGGTWYLFATAFGYIRTRNASEPGTLVYTVNGEVR